jgi:hypothetical protein
MLALSGIVYQLHHPNKCGSSSSGSGSSFSDNKNSRISIYLPLPANFGDTFTS